MVLHFRDTNIEVQTGMENLLKTGKAQTINHTFCFSGPGLFLLLYILEEYPLLAKALSNVSVLGSLPPLCDGAKEHSAPAV